MVAVPEVDLVPDHAPEAVHDDASAEDQLNVLPLPEAIELGAAANETVGAVSTVMVAACEAVPPGPVQARA